MKKNGWGLRVELLFILLFIVCLIIAVIGLNRMGVIGGDLSSINVGNNKESIENINKWKNHLSRERKVHKLFQQCNLCPI